MRSAASPSSKCPVKPVSETSLENWWRSIVGTHNSVVILAFVLAFGAWFPNQAWAEDAEDPRSQTLSLPYAFYNDSFGAAGGYVFGLSGYPEPQSSLLAAAMAGTEGAGMVFITGQDLRPGWEGGDLDRVFFDPIVSVGYFNEVEVFVDGDPRFNDRRAGAANSDEDDSITGEGWDYFFRLRMKYLMPFGHAEEDIIARYVIKDGLLESGATGGRSLNPLLSGRTFLELQPFYRSQDIKSDEITSDLKSNGIDISLFWDNRDFPRNPERGQGLQFKLTRDFGLFDSSESWTAVQFEYDQYFSLGADDTFRQRVLAFDFWTADSVTWKVSPSGEIMNRPPAYAGATLGGLWRKSVV